MALHNNSEWVNIAAIPADTSKVIGEVCIIPKDWALSDKIDGIYDVLLCQTLDYLSFILPYLKNGVLSALVIQSLNKITID